MYANPRQDDPLPQSRKMLEWNKNIIHRFFDEPGNKREFQFITGTAYRQCGGFMIL